MVIICLLRSHCFMRLACSPPVPLSHSLSLSYSHYILLALSYCCYSASMFTLSLLSLITLHYFFFTFISVSHFGQFTFCLFLPVISLLLLSLHCYSDVRSTTVESIKLLKTCTWQVADVEIHPSVSLHYKLRLQQISHPLNL